MKIIDIFFIHLCTDAIIHISIFTFWILQPYIKLVYEPTYSLEETMDVFARETNKDISKLNEIDENDNDSVEGTVYILGQ